MSLSETDRQLLERCLEGKPRAWEDFVDRFLGLILHVIDHTTRLRSISISAVDREDMAAEVLLELVRNDQAILRRFRRASSLATYLTVVVRRLIVRRLLAEAQTRRLPQEFATRSSSAPSVGTAALGAHEEQLANREEVEKLLMRLDPREANVVRLYHLEGKSYSEISRVTGLPENSLGPMLTRARNRLRDKA